MNSRTLLWRYVFDPLVRKIERRLAHFASLKPPTHSGDRWKQRAVIGDSVVFYPEALVANDFDRDQIIVGNNCHIAGGIVVLGAGRFEIGHDSFVGPDSRLWCSHSMRIGSRVLISHLVDIHDSDSHSLDWRLRRDECLSRFGHDLPSSGVDVKMSPVVIEDDVWIGFKSSILKGVTIGRGSVIAACSLVTKDVPPFTLVAGNPARVMRALPK